MMGFSWPFTTPVCRAVNTSGQATGVGSAPSSFQMVTHCGISGTRSLRPFTSAGVGMGLLAVSSRAPRRERPRIRRLPFFTSASFSFSPILPL